MVVTHAVSNNNKGHQPAICEHFCALVDAMVGAFAGFVVNNAVCLTNLLLQPMRQLDTTRMELKPIPILCIEVI